MFDFLLKPTTASVSTNGPDDPGQTPGSPGRPAQLTLTAAMELIRPPRPPLIGASAFAHHTDTDECARDMLNQFDQLDRSSPEMQALIVSTSGSFYGELLAERLSPNTAVGKPKAKRRKRQPKGKQPHFPNLVSLANELAAVRED